MWGESAAHHSFRERLLHAAAAGAKGRPGLRPVDSLTRGETATGPTPRRCHTTTVTTSATQKEQACEWLWWGLTPLGRGASGELQGERRREQHDSGGNSTCRRPAMQEAGEPGSKEGTGWELRLPTEAGEAARTVQTQVGVILFLEQREATGGSGLCCFVCGVWGKGDMIKFTSETRGTVWGMALTRREMGGEGRDPEGSSDSSVRTS